MRLLNKGGEPKAWIWRGLTDNLSLMSTRLPSKPIFELTIQYLRSIWRFVVRSLLLGHVRKPVAGHGRLRALGAIPFGRRSRDPPRPNSTSPEVAR